MLKIKLMPIVRVQGRKALPCRRRFVGCLLPKGSRAKATSRSSQSASGGAGGAIQYERAPARSRAPQRPVLNGGEAPRPTSARMPFRAPHLQGEAEGQEEQACRSLLTLRLTVRERRSRYASSRGSASSRSTLTEPDPSRVCIANQCVSENMLFNLSRRQMSGR